MVVLQNVTILKLLVLVFCVYLHTVWVCTVHICYWSEQLYRVHILSDRYPLVTAATIPVSNEGSWLNGLL
jgi:hypothetical protein